MGGVLPPLWHKALGGTPSDAEIAAILAKVQADRDSHHIVYPPADLVFRALELTPPTRVRAVILGQDPYHEAGQAQGLSFSVPDGVPPPPTLVNVLAAVSADEGFPVPASGNLTRWANDGVLLLNTVLTVRQGAAWSHAGFGWQELTHRIIQVVDARPGPVVFLLWGRDAQKLGHAIDKERHIVLPAPHPSPLSAWRGFAASHPFSTANALLAARSAPPIDWRL